MYQLLAGDREYIDRKAFLSFLEQPASTRPETARRLNTNIHHRFTVSPRPDSALYATEEFRFNRNSGF